MLFFLFYEVKIINESVDEIETAKIKEEDFQNCTKPLQMNNTFMKVDKC